MAKPIVVDRDIIRRLKRQHRLQNLLCKNRCKIDDLIDTARATDAMRLLAMLPDNSVDLIFTDEPYGITSSIIAFYSRKAMVMDFEWDGNLPAHLTLPWVFEANRVLKDNSALVCCGISSWNTTFEDICHAVGLTFKCHDAWIKTNATTRMRPGGFRSAYEMIWIAAKGSLSKRMGKRHQQELLNWTWEAHCPDCGAFFPVAYSKNYDISKLDWYGYVEDWQPQELVGASKHHQHRMGHNTAKPDWLAARYIDMLSDEGDVILDMFMGEGTFPRMARRMGRHFIAGDINPEWVEKFTERDENRQVSVV